ncbi:MAG TPA: ABC transporter permease [Pyrinomonadaceae bacterium]|jgi:putative ABC transport system permease protein|nr:ABC transporter permease [Pyrinomonadaceae bacterium]
MGTLWQDLRFGARVLLRQPAFTLVAVVTLALGIGANTAIFSVVNAVLLRPLPYAEGERIVTLWETQGASREVHVSYPNFSDWRDGQRSFESFSGYTGRWGGPSTVTGGAEPGRANGVGVFRDFFKVMGVAPLVGRGFAPEDHRPGANPAVIASYGFWQKALGGARDLAGARLSVEGQTFAVVGVMPPGFDFPADTQLWYAREAFGEDTSARSSHNYVAVARLRPGVTPAQAQGDMDAVARRLAGQYSTSLTRSDRRVRATRPSCCAAGASGRRSPRRRASRCARSTGTCPSTSSRWALSSRAASPTAATA